jgi:acetyl esterase/lipase
MPMTVRFDLAAPYEVEEVDVPFARPEGKELLARVYRPRGEIAEPLVAVVDVHGGAWTRNDRTSGPHHGRGLAAAGVVVVSLDFRQGPEHKHPAASADIAAGVRWVRAHARRLGVDPTLIGTSGSSSGGQLALLAGVKPGAGFAITPIMLPDGSLDGTAGDESVAFVLALYPVADPLARYRYLLTRKDEPPQPSGFNAKNMIESHHGYFPSEAAMADASVTRIVTTGEARALPPIFVAQPEFDDNMPPRITEALVREYQQVGGSVEHMYFSGARHGFIGRESAETDKCIAIMRDFIGRHLRGESRGNTSRGGNA